MTPEEIRNAGERQLSRHRLELLQRPCPVCDQGQARTVCTCQEDLREVDLIDRELLKRAREEL